MSIKSSLVLVFLLCCLYQSCNARSFGIFHEESTAKESNAKQNKILNENRVSLPSNWKSSAPVNYTTANSDPVSDKKLRSKQNNNSRNDIPNKGKKVKVVRTTKKEEHPQSLQETVAWKVPYKKRGEKDPNFNLDYLPPRTHPPAHN